MHIYRCHLTLHEPLFYAGREIGRLYETGRYLHNYSLAYAFGLVQSPWFHAEQVPHYAEDLNALAEEVYVTPAQPLEIRFQLATFKYGEEVLHVEMQQATRNTPSFGRAKEIAAESSFVCYVISRQEQKLPRWIRLGKWHSKTFVEVEEVQVVEKKRDYRAVVPLNPLDLVEADTLRAFDMISMPPASLVANAYCYGEYYELSDGYGLPKRMKFQV
jgi:CRISPR-associated protein Csc1